MKELRVMDAPIGCREPELGREVSLRLGEGLPRGLQEHVGGCLACQVERRAFERFGALDEMVDAEGLVEQARDLQESISSYRRALERDDDFPF